MLFFHKTDPFNDIYGYAKGDEILLCLARCLGEQIDSSCDFVGHIGGDDFMLVMRPEDWSGKVSRLFAAFEQRWQPFYHDEHLAAGCFIAEGRQGSLERYPLLSLSIGAVHVRPDPDAELDAAHLAQLASQAKRQAKHTPGFSLHVLDTTPPSSGIQSPIPAAMVL